MTPAEFYGLQPVMTAPPAVASTAAGTVPQVAGSEHSPIATTEPTASKSWHQRPVLILVLIVAGAWVLSRLAEHGAGFGVWGKA